MVLLKLTIAGGVIVPEIEMRSSDTVSDLKRKIEKELDVEVFRQRLKRDNRKLIDHELIHDFCFRVRETLTLTVTPLRPEHELEVKVKLKDRNGRVAKPVAVRVKETDKVSDLRSKVGRQWGIPSELIVLKRCKVEMKDDNLPLSAYFVNQGSEIQFSVSTEHGG